jgi:hypothetical protein
MKDGTFSAMVINPLIQPISVREMVKVDHVVHQERRETVDEAHRQVHLAADQQQYLAHRDDRHRGSDLGQVDQVVLGEEGGGFRPEVNEQCDQDDQDRRFPLLHEPDPGAPQLAHRAARPAWLAGQQPGDLRAALSCVAHVALPSFSRCWHTFRALAAPAWATGR